MRFARQSVLFLLVLFTLQLVTSHPVAAVSSSDCAPDGRHADDAVYRICMPTLTRWNRELVIYAHGYVAFNEPIAIPEDQLSLSSGPSIPEIVNTLGYAFATTSYSVNGLAIRQGLDDVVDLVNVFSSIHGEPRRIYIVGPSEGGIITALAVEQYPDIFDGGLSACGPVGDFPAQINYWGDVRVTFDYFFPGVLPGSPIAIPNEAIDQWESVYEPRIQNELRAKPDQRAQWMNVVDIPAHPTSLDETIDALTQLLWYSTFATNDGIEKLGGQPFDNRDRIYQGARDDARLNYAIKRYTADAAAVDEMQTSYQTTGDLLRPLVMLHTTDPLIPLWHEGLYARKVAQMENIPLVTTLPFPGRYGHCNFRAAQALVGFVVLVYKVTSEVPADAAATLASTEERAEFEILLEQYLAPFMPTEPRTRLFLPALQAD